MDRPSPTIEEALILGDDYDVGGGITIHQPTVCDIMRHGEAAYDRTVKLMTAISSDCKASLADIGLDWCNVSDFEMFIIASRGLTPEDTTFLLNEDVDLSTFELRKNGKGEAQLRSPDGKYVIDAQVHRRLSDFLCCMHQIVKKPEFPANDFAREMLLEESRAARAQAMNAHTQPVLPSLISFVANASGSKYDYEACTQLKYSIFMDAVARLQIIGNASALRNACYSGMIDTSKIDKSALNMMRDINHTGEAQVVRQVTNTTTIGK